MKNLMNRNLFIIRKVPNHTKIIENQRFSEMLKNHWNTLRKQQAPVTVKVIFDMVKRIGGIRRKTRYKFRKEKRRKGKLSITRYFQSFNTGDIVYLNVESAVQKGMYYPRFMGKTAVIKGRRGSCYEVAINDLGKEKTLVVHPVHLKKVAKTSGM